MLSFNYIIFVEKFYLTRKLLYNFLLSKKKPLFSGSNIIEEDGEYIEESCEHFLDKEKALKF